MAVSTAGIVARQRFGAALKEARLNAPGGPVKQIEVAHALGRRTVDRVSRLERGATWPEPKELKTLLRVFKADTETRVRLETMLAEGRAITGAWWTEFQEEFPETLIEFVAYEDSATHLITCAGNNLPGLLQTEEYGRTLAAAVTKTRKGALLVDRAIELRRARRGLFEKQNPPMVEAIIGEAALRQLIGGREVMSAQLDSLIEDVEKNRVTLRMVPFDSNIAIAYMFHIIEFGVAHENPVAAFDAMNGMSFKKDMREIRGLKVLVESLREMALTPVDTLEFIKTVKKELARD